MTGSMSVIQQGLLPKGTPKTDVSERIIKNGRKGVKSRRDDRAEIQMTKAELPVTVTPGRPTWRLVLGVGRTSSAS
jgi:hypothetical protein